MHGIYHTTSIRWIQCDTIRSTITKFPLFIRYGTILLYGTIKTTNTHGQVFKMLSIHRCGVR